MYDRRVVRPDAPSRTARPPTITPVNVLGISLGHDSSVSLVENGRILGILEAERYFRQKRYKLHCLTLEAGKHLSGFQTVDVDDLRRFLAMATGAWGTRFDAIAVQNQGRSDELANLLGVAAEAGIEWRTARHVDHHLAHASLAYYTSPFSEALVLSYDGMGNDGFTVLFKASGSSIEYLVRDPHQFGRSYNNLGYILGVRPDIAGSTAGKVMGLAGYAEPRPDWRPFAAEYVAGYQKLPPRNVDGLNSYGKGHRINSIGLDRIDDLQPFVEEVGDDAPGMRARLASLAGRRRTRELRLPGPEHPLAQSLAHTVQEAWTDEVLGLLDRFRDTSRNIAVVGGCALNGVTNYQIEQRRLFERTHFLPNPTDCGLSAGAALHAYYQLTGARFDGHADYLTPYLGAEPFDRADLPALQRRFPHRRIGGPEGRQAEALAALIHRNLMVGVIRGRYEVGPRALGNRSILCNPLNPSMRQILNDRVKRREWYRPFAPVVPAEDAPRFFTNAADIPYMSVICFTRPERRALLPSITHVDGSARVQTIRREHHPFLHATLKAFERLSGVPILLNTSFNPGGEPILNYCAVGLEMLNTTDLDLVLIDDVLFARDDKERLLAGLDS
jgi:predicted NodU family carbamoyl transferase